MSSSPNNQRALVTVVTGSSSGIGLATSIALARNSYLTYATMRNLAKRDSIQSIADKQHLSIRVVQLDVTDENSIKSAIQSILSEAGRIDLLVNNAGYVLTGACRIGYPGGYAYVSSKLALECLSESMVYEIEQFGIRTVLVEPGFVRT